MAFSFIQEQQYVEIDVGQLTIETENILAGLGMKLTDADDYLLELIKNLSDTAIKLAAPVASFSILNDPFFDLNTKILHLADFQFRTGRSITQLLKKSEKLVFFITSIGDELEKFSKEQMKCGNSLEGFILDLIGSELAENVANELHNFLQQKFEANGLGVSNRYSPGYCNWPVSDQENLFTVMGEFNCGVSLNKSSLMMPMKSVSGVIGVGGSLRRIDYKCRVCDDNKCIMRKQF